jgi:tetratricopeptide (TPR) repeat protein
MSIEYRLQNTEYRRQIECYRLFYLSVVLCLFLLVFGASVEGKQLSKTELELWNSPSFKKQLTESYLAETEIEPRVTQDEREQMLKVLNLISSDKMDEAARLLQKETKDASSAVFDFTLANIYFQQEQFGQAVAGYEKAVAKYPKFRRAWKNLGLIHVREGEFEKTITSFTRVIELGGSDALTYGLLGFAYSSIENNLCAESAYRIAILLDPATIDWKMGLARSLFKQQRYAEAVALCDNLLTDNPDRADLWLLQANAYIGQNMPLKAAVNYEIVDRMGQSTVASLNMLGDIYVNQELFEKAVASYISALEKNPQSSADRALRAAKVLVSRSAFPETKQLIERIESLRGGNLSKTDRKDLLKIRARIAVAAGAGQEEVKVLEEIVDLDPLDGEALILLGQNSARSGDLEKAVFYYERAENLEKYEADAKIRHAQLLVGQGKYTEALPLLRRAQELKPHENVQKYLEQIERLAKSH